MDGTLTQPQSESERHKINLNLFKLYMISYKTLQLLPSLTKWLKNISLVFYEKWMFFID